MKALTLLLPLLGIAIAAVTVVLMVRVERARRRRPLTGSEGMVGELGEAVAPLVPDGKVFVHGEYWDATALSLLPRGARVRVIGVRGAHLTVEDARDGRD